MFINSNAKTSYKYEILGLTYLFEAFFTERTLRVVVQTAFQTGLTESVTTGSRDGLIEQPWNGKDDDVELNLLSSADVDWHLSFLYGA